MLALQVSFQNALKQFEKTENVIFSIIRLQFSRCVPVVSTVSSLKGPGYLAEINAGSVSCIPLNPATP